MDSMPANMRRQLTGEFAAENLGNGAWRFMQSEPSGIAVFLKGVNASTGPGARTGADAGEALRGGTVSDIEIVWRPSSVAVSFNSGGAVRSLEITSAIVHEPKPHLYDQLPLAQFEPKARRFWRRVFRVVQIPGGRHLLGVLARGARARR
jgi:hypothetical protein